MSVLYSCPFVPAEWIAAHGLRPRREAPRARRNSGERFAGLCPYADAFAELAGEAEGVRAVIVSTACDQMRRISEVIQERSPAPLFLFNLPHTWRDANAVRLYRSELRRLGDFLSRVGGEPPARDLLVETVREYDRRRTVLRDARGALSARAWAEAAARFHATGKAPEIAGAGAARKASRRPPVALIGGPLPADRFELYDEIEAAGAEIALDGTETGERTLPAPVQKRLLTEDPVAAITEAYFGAIPDPFRRPNSEFFRWVREEVVRRRIVGVVVRRYLWCDVWHAEEQRLADMLPVPVLAVEAADEDGDRERNRTRLAAFVEGLQP